MPILENKGGDFVTITEFGEIVLLSTGEKFPEGIVLHKVNDSVLLERVNGDDQNAVLEEFEELITKADFCNCLKVALEYEKDFSVPIYIAVETGKFLHAEEEETEEESRRACFACMAEWNRNHPWSLIPPSERCSSCLKRENAKPA